MILFLFKTVESMVFDVMRMISTQIRWQDPCWSLFKLWEHRLDFECMGSRFPPAMVFSKPRFDFVRKTTIKKLKYIYIFQKPEHCKKYIFLSKCIEKNQKNTVNKVEENEPEKLNNLLITDYAKVKNKEQKRWQPHASQNSYTFQALKWTRIHSRFPW